MHPGAGWIPESLTKSGNSLVRKILQSAVVYVSGPFLSLLVAFYLGLDDS